MSPRDILRQPRNDNRSSWRWMVAYYDDLMSGSPSSTLKEHYEPIREMVIRLANSPYADKFRAGQQLLDMMISTKDRNGLEQDDPFIHISAHYKTGALQVEYWRGEYRDGLIESHSDVARNDLLKVVEPLLARLWQETQRKRIETE